MADPANTTLRGRRLLVVEDEYVIAADLAGSLQDAGVEVIGPAGSVNDALAYIADQDVEMDGAVLDINLGRERVFPVADALSRKNVPFVFLTGYDSQVVPEAYAAVPRYHKPFDRALLILMFQGKEQ